MATIKNVYGSKSFIKCITISHTLSCDLGRLWNEWIYGIENLMSPIPTTWVVNILATTKKSEHFYKYSLGNTDTRKKNSVVLGETGHSFHKYISHFVTRFTYAFLVAFSAAVKNATSSIVWISRIKCAIYTTYPAKLQS